MEGKSKAPYGTYSRRQRERRDVGQRLRCQRGGPGFGRQGCTIPVNMEKSTGIAGWRKSQRAEISAHTRVVFAATRGTLGRSANRSKAAPAARAARMQLYAPA